MQKKAIIFDFDLTLADATKGIFQCMNQALNQLGFPEKDFETIKKTIGHTLPNSFKILTGNSDSKTAEEFVKKYTSQADKIMNVNTFVYPQVFKILPLIKEKGLQTAIVSTKYRYRIEEILTRDNLNQYFDYVVGGEDVICHKPNPEGLLKALEKLGISKNEALYVGDSTIDAEAAKNADITFCAVLTGTSTQMEFEELVADYVTDDLNGLIQILGLNTDL
jgi:phosphoglycolate phosphatase